MPYPSYQERKNILNRQPQMRNMWIALLAYEAASTVWSLIVVARVIIQPQSSLTNIPEGTPAAVFVVSAAAGLLFGLVMQGIVMVSMYRLESWVQWLLWLGAVGSTYTLLAPSMSIMSRLAGILGIAAAFGYAWITRQMKRSSEIPLPPPTMP